MTRPGRRSRLTGVAVITATATAYVIAMAVIGAVVGVGVGLFVGLFVGGPDVGAAVGVFVAPGSGVGLFRVARKLVTEAPGWRSAKVPTITFMFRFRARLRSFSASSLTDLAALIAGRRRPTLLVEWRAHLAGENGHDPATWQKVRQALGFVAAAIQLRRADAADLAWRPVDAILASRTLSNLFVGGPVIVVLYAIVHHDGRFGLVTDIQDAGELGAFLYGVVRVGRWWRQIKLPEPKPRRARE